MFRPIRWLMLALLAATILLPSSLGFAADPPKAVTKADAHDSHGHDSHAADPLATDPISFDADLALWTLVVFVVLLAVLKKFAWGPILSGLEQRENHIATEIRSAEDANAEAKRLLASYETRLTQAQDEVRAILDEARRDAEHVKNDIMEKAKTEAATEMARAKREVETARDQAKQELLHLSVNLAVDLAGKIVQAKLSSADHQQLITEALGKFPSTTPSRN